jgi:SAM-dependent methyltransferase
MSTQVVEQLWEVAEECAVCSSSHYKDMFAVHEKSFVKCKNCGVVRLYNRIAEDKLDLLYNSYYQNVTTTPTREQLAKELANPTFAFRYRRLSKFVNSQSPEFFEIGCGDGNFLAYLRAKGWQVSGSEFGKETQDIILKRHNLTIFGEDFTKLPLVPDSLGVIGAYHLLEHLYRPRQWLQTVHRSLRRGGILHLQLPNIGSWEARFTGSCWGFISFPQHVYLYTSSNLSEFLKSEGFEVISIATYDPFHSPATTLISLRNSLKKGVTGKTSWRNWSPALPGNKENRVASAKNVTQVFNKIVTPLTTVLARVESAFGYGNVIDVIAKKI